mmetsp:Transcript_5786/g.12234  ORF Transcript_5786/g.12234 Transcript_5786/m.12234 type:complete len:1161 (-) Transcript_5786:2258-5740(-)
MKKQETYYTGDNSDPTSSHNLVVGGSQGQLILEGHSDVEVHEIHESHDSWIQQSSDDNLPCDRYIDRSSYEHFSQPEQNLPYQHQTHQNNDNQNVRNNPPPSTVILHKIVSYLSLGDAESIASLAHNQHTFDRLCNHNSYNITDHYHTNNNQYHPSPHSDHGVMYNTGHISTATVASSMLLPGYHSLDHHVYYSGAEESSGYNQRQRLHRDGMNTNINKNNMHSNIHYNNNCENSTTQDEDEGWFVGSLRQNSSASLASGLTTLIDTPMTPGLVALSPLEEEWQDGDHDSDVGGALEQRCWTPAGQATCENELDTRGDALCHRADLSRDTANFAMENEGGSIKSDNINRNRNISDDIERDVMDKTNIVTEKEMHAMEIERRQRRQALQQKLAAAVFAHPHPLSDYCLDAYATALKLSIKRQHEVDKHKQHHHVSRTHHEKNHNNEAFESHQPEEHTQARESPAESPPETLRDRVVSPSTALHDIEVSPELGEYSRERVMTHHEVQQRSVESNSNYDRGQYPNHHEQQQHTQRYTVLQWQEKERQKNERMSRAKILRIIMSKLLQSVPLSVLLDAFESAFDLSVDTLFAVGKISSFTMHSLVSILCNATNIALDILTRFNPFHIFQFVINAQRSAMGKTGEVLVSGIQSVAHGVGHASSAALNNLSRQGLALAGGVVGGSASGLSRAGGTGSASLSRMRKESVNDVHGLNSKLFRRLHKMDSVSRLIAYSERKDEEAFGKSAKRRAQRMMHYNVSFRPFTATIQPRSPKKSGKTRASVSFENGESPRRTRSQSAGSEGGTVGDDDSISTASLQGSIFMCTPTSFPPTPTSRFYYFERGSRFTENVIFLARDQLRVEGGLGSTNEQTRAMSKALREGSRLAVFNAADAGGGIALSCGQHIATKVGNSLYCSARSMIPVMRNSYVYFEISVSPPPPCNYHNSSNIYIPQVDVTTLSIGLSTLEMSLNTLVGAVKGSVGLCTTGQILIAGQWFSPDDPRESSYGSNSTVGCLVYLDDRSVYDTREGVMVTADVTFNINGNVVPPAVCSSALCGGSGPNNQLTNSHLSKNQICDCDDAPTLTMTVPRVQELFPTVTLHSPATCVMCRFNAEDLLASTREEIGAPLGVTVYSVDGSVILDDSSDVFSESDEFDSSSSCEAHDEVTL